MRPLFTNTARKKKAELCAMVTLSITGDTSHRGPPNLPETAAGRPHKVFLQSSPGQIKALALFTHRPQALWGQPQTHRGVLGMTAAVRASSQNLPSSLLMFRDERDSGARQNCLHHHIPPPSRHKKHASSLETARSIIKPVWKSPRSHESDHVDAEMKKSFTN